jgi:hypothetical protein
MKENDGEDGVDDDDDDDNLIIISFPITLII